MKAILHKMQHRPKAVLFVLLFVTILIRIPQLTRPLSKHHELNTAAVLTCIQVWNENGIGFSNGTPVHMFPGNYNIFNDLESRYPNLLASGTYLSMGPLSYMVPWAVFKILHIPPAETSLRAFMLVLQLLSLFLFYNLVKQVFKTTYRRNFTDSKTLTFDTPYYHGLAVSFFLFSPAIMWFMGNAYCHEIMVLPLYLAAFYTGFKIIQSDYKWHLKSYLLYGGITAAAVYTDWLGGITALVFFVQAISIKKFNQRLPFLLTNAIAVAIPASIIMWQYSSVVGFTEYRGFFFEQLFHRRQPDGGLVYIWLDYIKHFITGYGFFFIAAIAGIVFNKVTWSRPLWIMFFIPLLHYLLFRGFSNEHDYSVLKWSPFVMLWAVFCMPQLKKKWEGFMVIVMLCFAVFLYEYLNPPGAESYAGDRYAWMKETGKRIATEARPDEYIFMNTPSYYYQVGWYAKRNYKNVANMAEARRWLSYQTGSKGIFFQLVDRQPIQATRFTK